MFIGTHKKIARSAYSILSDRLKELIDREAFIEGSYFPDINLKMTVISHGFDSTIGIVNKQVESIIDKKQTPQELGKKLGIICHFLADYCSPYHTNEKYRNKNIITHLNYERKTNNGLDFIFFNDNELRNKSFHSVYTLERDLVAFIKTHMQGALDMHRETKLSLINSYQVVNLIMAEYIKIHIDKDNYIELIPVAQTPAAAYYPPVASVQNALFDEAEYVEVNQIP